MKLKVGTKAPSFTLESINKGTVSLDDYKGKQVLLIFSRYFGCTVCQLDWDDTIKLASEIDTDIVYFTQSKPETTKEYLKKYQIDFPVIPVPKTNGQYPIYKDYGLGNFGIGTGIKLLQKAQKAKKAGKVHGEYEGKETQTPGDFMVDGEGKVIRAHVGLLEADEIHAFLKSV